MRDTEKALLSYLSDGQEHKQADIEQALSMSAQKVMMAYYGLLDTHIIKRRTELCRPISKGRPTRYFTLVGTKPVEEE